MAPAAAIASVKPWLHFVGCDGAIIIAVEAREHLERRGGELRQGQLAVTVLVEALEHLVVHVSEAGLLIGGGGNDVVYETPTTPSPLFNMLAQAPLPGAEPLVEAIVHQFIDIELSGYYKTIIDAVRSVTAIPMSNPPSAPQPATGSTRSPSPKPATLPSTNRLSPSEIESLRQENKQAQEWMMAQLAKDK